MGSSDGRERISDLALCQPGPTNNKSESDVGEGGLVVVDKQLSQLYGGQDDVVVVDVAVVVRSVVAGKLDSELEIVEIGEDEPFKHFAPSKRSNM